MTELLLLLKKDQQPVTSLGLTFPDDAARREHFTALLAEKLKDPAFAPKLQKTMLRGLCPLRLAQQRK